MKYQDPKEISRDEAIRIFSAGTSDEICDALLSVALYDEDWKWSQDRCLHFLSHPDPDVRGVAVSCLGHIARIHNRLDKEKVVSALMKCMKDEHISGRVQDALDDIQMFL